ncbi:MAG: hypothetical protein Q9217_001432 [Psora testacea]
MECLLPARLTMFPLLLITFSSVIIATGLKVWRRRHFQKLRQARGCDLPKKISAKDPILGIDSLLGSCKSLKHHRYLEHATNRFAEHGTTFESNMMGTTVINTVEPENIKAILSTAFDHYELGPRRKNAFTPLIGHGIFTSDGVSWKHSRQLLRPNFSREQFYNLSLLEYHIRHLIDAIPRDGSVVDLQDLFFRFTMDAGTELLFGKSALSLLSETDGIDGNFSDAFSRCQATMTKNYCLGEISLLIPNRQFKGDCSFVQAWVDRLVKEALRSTQRETETVSANPKAFGASSDSFMPKGRYVFLYELAKQTNDPIILRSELLNLLIASRDTTAALLGNMWFEIARRPDVWAKLREEVDGLGVEKFTIAHLKGMKYLYSCLDESLRLHPPVPVNSRTSLRDTILPVGGGDNGKSPVFVSRGTIIGYNLFAMHRRKDIYGPDADDFRPERWENLRPGWAFLPFNGGSRVCLGRQLALTEAAYVTVRLMQEFTGIEGKSCEPWRESLHLTCCSYGGTKVILTPAQT